MDLRRLVTDVLALGLLAATVFVGVSLLGADSADAPARVVHPVPEHVANPGGPLGAKVAHTLRSGLGLGAYFVLAAMAVVDLRLFSRHELDRKFWRALGWTFAATAVCLVCTLYVAPTATGPVVGSGGYVGAMGVALLEPMFEPTGIAVLAVTLFVSGLLMTGEAVRLGPVVGVVTLPLVPFRKAAELVRPPARYRAPTPEPDADDSVGRASNPSIPTAVDEEAAVDEADDVVSEFDRRIGNPSHVEADDSVEPDVEPESEPEPERQPLRINPPVSVTNERDSLAENLREHATTTSYELPDLDILEEPEDFPYELLAKKAELAAATLERTFKEFGLNVRVSEVDTGPVITQFELDLEPGLRLNKVTALADDLAIALRVPSVRVVAPIPGKNTVGIEVPNEKQVMVRLRELIEARSDEVNRKRIPLFLGKDVGGAPLVVDMTKMPHLLIAGRTGTGKSVCLNTLILSILATRTPDDVKMLMIDPKMVELSPYKRVPHLMHPVITDMKKAEAVLAWAVDKMEERYDLLARCGVRHLDGYNKLTRQQRLERMGVSELEEEAESVPDRMPYIVIVADEMADMMMTSGKDVEGHIIRLAQKSRAVGIHLVLATQKPSVDVITGLIKSNLPARISFQVASKTDSRVVLDENGADKLLGSGDMLYLAPGTSNLTRAQGTYVSDEEIEAIIDFYSDYEPEYSDEVAKASLPSAAGGGSGESAGERDELYDEAVEVVIREQTGSVSRLQRFLGIGYGRAARLIDYMAEDGIVGDYNGSKAREVLYKPDEWEAMRAGRGEPVGV